MIGFLSTHWELKVVALVLAVALWIYTSGQASVEREVRVDARAAQVIGLPDGYRIASIEPAELRVLLSVPANRIDDLTAEAIAPRLELAVKDGRAEAVQTFPVDPRLLGLHHDLRVVSIAPPDARITVTLDPLVEGALPVEAPELIGVPSGLEAVVGLSATRVKVRAAERTIEDYRVAKRALRFQPVTLGDIDPLLPLDRIERVVLAPADPAVQVVDGVIATIVLRPATAQQRVDLPVQVLMGAGLATRYRVELEQPMVAVTVRGPGNLLKTLKADELNAYVGVRREPEGDAAVELPVFIVGPSWLVADAARVRARVLPLARAP